MDEEKGIEDLITQLFFTESAKGPYDTSPSEIFVCVDEGGLVYHQIDSPKDLRVSIDNSHDYSVLQFTYEKRQNDEELIKKILDISSRGTYISMALDHINPGAFVSYINHEIGDRVNLTFNLIYRNPPTNEEKAKIITSTARIVSRYINNHRSEDAIKFLDSK